MESTVSEFKGMSQFSCLLISSQRVKLTHEKAGYYFNCACLTKGLCEMALKIGLAK